VPPLVTVCEFGSLTIEIAGCVTADHVTAAVSCELTGGPTGGVPVATAVLVKLAVTFASVQV